MLGTAVFTFAALDALLWINGVRLSELAGDSADGAVAGALRAADALFGVYPHRAQRAANAGRALFVLNMGDIFVLEILERAENGIRCSLAEAAQRAGMNGLCNFLKSVEILQLTLTLGYTLKYAQHLGYALTAGRALAA